VDVYHTSTHHVALVRIWNAGLILKCTARGLLKIQDAKLRHAHHRIQSPTDENRPGKKKEEQQEIRK